VVVVVPTGSGASAVAHALFVLREFLAMATHPYTLRRAAALALLLGGVGTPAWAASDPHARPAAQEARIPTPGTHQGGGADDGVGDGIPGIVPIGCGLLLTGIAVYKHRGLPRSSD
jgi:hypothetical protein